MMIITVVFMIIHIECKREKSRIDVGNDLSKDFSFDLQLFNVVFLYTIKSINLKAIFIILLYLGYTTAACVHKLFYCHVFKCIIQYTYVCNQCVISIYADKARKPVE